MRSLLEWLLSFFLLPGAYKAPDVQREAAAAPPKPEVKVVEPVIGVEGTRRWYWTPAMAELARLIRLHESGKAGYNADFRNDDKWILKDRTFDAVRVLSRKQVEQGEPSSAIGAYQFLTKTLDSLKESLNLKGSELFTNQFQDDLAVALMIRRGLMKFLREEMSLQTFCNQLAMEWASLPVVTNMKGGSRQVKAGQSYYAGDGLNKAFHKPETILQAVSMMGTELRKTMPKGE